MFFIPIAFNFIPIALTFKPELQSASQVQIKYNNNVRKFSYIKLNKTDNNKLIKLNIKT